MNEPLDQSLHAEYLAEISKILEQINVSIGQIPFRELHNDFRELRKEIRRAIDQRDAATVESDRIQTEQETIIRAQNETILRT